MKDKRLVFFANTDWYLLNFRAALLEAAQAAGYSILCVSPKGKFTAHFAQMGLRWVPLPFERESRIGMLRSLFVVRKKLRQLFRSEEPAMVHSFTLTAILLAWMSLPSRSVTRRINAVTGLGYAFTADTLKHRLLRLFLNPVLKRALNHKRAWTVVQNETDRDFLIDAFDLPEERVLLIPGSGVDVMLFSPQPVDRVGNTVVIGFVGRLLADKGIAEFVEAARRVRRRFPHVRFVAAGAPDPGNPAAVGRQCLAEWKAAGNVEFIGQVDDMPSFFRGLDVFVLPSYREGLSRSLIEAGACGLPAVTTDAPGCRDVVEDGRNGRLVPVQDAQALSDAIFELVESPFARRRMGQAARDIVEKKFSNEIINGATLALYEAVLAESEKTKRVN